MGISDYRLGQIKRYFGITVSESAWKRWGRWWRESFAVTPLWQQAKGLCLPGIEEQGPFPRNLFSVFTEPIEERMNLLLKFLSPLTGGERNFNNRFILSSIGSVNTENKLRGKGPCSSMPGRHNPLACCQKGVTANDSRHQRRQRFQVDSLTVIPKYRLICPRR